MNGGRDGTRDAESDDRDSDPAGDFEFGPEREPIDDSSAGPGTATDADTVRRSEETRIKVDLRDDDPEGSEPPTSDPGFDPSGSGPDPGPDAVRNWSLLAVALAVASFATGAFTFAAHDDLAPVAGVAGLGVAFAILGALPRFGRSTLLEGLSAGWLEHRRYVRFSIALFAFGTVVGVVLLFAGVNLLDLIAEMLEEGLFPELEDEQFQLTATFFIRNNSQPFLLSIVGALSLGLLTAFLMVFNGVIVGNVAAAVGGELGVGYILTGIAPHGIFELPALFIAAGVGFRLLYRFGERVSGSRDAFVTKPYLYRTLAFAVFGWLLLVLAAFVEAYVTPELLELLFAGAGESGPASP